MVKKSTKKGENLELAKEHVKIAGDLVYEESGKSKKDKKNKDTVKRTIFSLERAESGIEELSAVAAGFLAIVGIGSGFYLLSPTITGRVISETIQPALNIIGVVLIVLGVMAGFFALKKKGKK